MVYENMFQNSKSKESEADTRGQEGLFGEREETKVPFTVLCFGGLQRLIPPTQKCPKISMIFWPPFHPRTKTVPHLGPLVVR